MDNKLHILSQLPEAILPWYDENHRNLPWRADRDPYHIWVSEIMLQQTRVETVKTYYTRFLAHLPTVADLALADDGLLQKLWEGLGYYSRVRNMKKAAGVIMEKHHGVFPTDYHAVLDLPGIGQYTAGAICSIAYGQKTPAVDGNVLRVYSRLVNDETPIDTPALKQNVSQLISMVYPKRAGDFTQALMELGATVCGPNRKPDCQNCPCSSFCVASKNGVASSLPVRSIKKPRRQEELTVFILKCDHRYALEKRSDCGLLAGLWQFPNTAGKLSEDQAISYLQDCGQSVRDIVRKTEKVHIFTHIQWNMRGYYMQVDQMNPEYRWVDRVELINSVALPTAFRLFLE